MGTRAAFLVLTFSIICSAAGLGQQETAAIQAYAQVFRGFEVNQGQTDPSVKFLSRGNRYTLFLAKDETVLAGASRATESQPEAVRIRLVGGNRNPRVAGEDQLPAKSSYFTGNRAKRWRCNIPSYAKVRYSNVYAGVDMIYRGGAGELEYDFLVRPGADPRKIRFHFEGVRKLELNAQGDLILHTAAGEVRQRKPSAYQEVNGVRRAVASHYTICSAYEASLESGPYDARQPLVIDPVLSYSSYIGGSGTSAGLSIAVDAQGDAYVAGTTAALDFPIKGGLQPSLRADTDLFLSKVNSSGSALVYSTYLGGSNRDIAYAIAVDGQGRAYVTGATWSADFPTAGAFQPAIGGDSDAFVSVLSPDGSALIYSTYLGGSGADRAYAIALDKLGRATIAGATESNDFPTANAFQISSGGGVRDGFVAQFNASGAALVFSTYLGGSAGDECHGIAVDASGNVYVTGATWSPDFPLKNALQQALAGNLFSDAFVVKLNPTGSDLVYATYLGGTEQDMGNAISVDAQGSAYVAGETSSPDFPTAGGMHSALGGRGSEDAFLAKLGPNGGALVYSMYLGGSDDDFATGVALDAAGNIVVSGGTASQDFPGSSGFVGPDSGLGDAFLTSLQSSGAISYSTRLGGAKSDLASGLAVDAAGNAYLTGLTDSADFPTFGAFESGSHGEGDAFISKVSAPASGATLTSVSAASYTAPLAPDSIASGFGANLGSVTTVQVTDSLSVQRPAPLFAVTPTQVNYLVPEGTAPGFANVTVVRGDGTSITGTVEIAKVAPALFAANANGKDVAAAIATVVTGSTQTKYFVFSNDPPGSRKPVPIDLGSADTQVYLELYGTGIRGHSSRDNLNPTNVEASIGGEKVPVLYAGPQNQFVGLDQVNLLLLRDLQGRGELNIVLTVDGQASNTVTVNIR